MWDFVKGLGEVYDDKVCLFPSVRLERAHISQGGKKLFFTPASSSEATLTVREDLVLT